MLNKKGFTLIETLFAFQIYLYIIILLSVFINNTTTKRKNLTHYYNEIIVKEEIISELPYITDIINQVLH